MSEQKDYISGLQISGKKHEINAKYLSGKELNDLMTKEPKSCSISELDTTTEPFVRVYFNESGVGQEHIVHTMVFDAYRRQIAYDCTTNSIKVRQYQDFWNSWIEIPTSLKTINGQSLLGSGDITINGGSDDNIYILDVRKENIEKSEVEHIYNHVSNGGIVFIKNDNNGYIIPSNISYDNLDVYSLEFRCHDIFTEYDLSDELRKYIIYISTIDGNTYTIDKYISINKYFTECLLDFSNSQTLSKNEFNEIVEALNKGKTPKYKIFDDKNIKIILFNVEEISEDRIFLSSSITSSNTIHTISINKSDNNYIFSYVEADM